MDRWTDKHPHTHVVQSAFRSLHFLICKTGNATCLGNQSLFLGLCPDFCPSPLNLLGAPQASTVCSYFSLLWSFQLPASHHPWSSYSVSLGKHHEAVWCQHSSSGKWEPFLLVSAPVVYKLVFFMI